MTYRLESEMYPDVCGWLRQFLIDRHRDSRIDVFDTSRKSLARLINEIGFVENLRPEWPSWDIYVDIVGFARTETLTTIALVECKLGSLTLSHLSQTIGYTRIVLPFYSMLLSPVGCSSSLQSLLSTFDRIDVLDYSPNLKKISKSVAVARWDEGAQTIDRASIIAGNDNTWR